VATRNPQEAPAYPEMLYPFVESNTTNRIGELERVTSPKQPELFCKRLLVFIEKPRQKGTK